MHNPQNAGDSPPKKTPIKSYNDLIGLISDPKAKKQVEGYTRNLSKLSGVKDLNILLPKIFDMMGEHAKEYADFSRILEEYEVDPKLVQYAYNILQGKEEEEEIDVEEDIMIPAVKPRLEAEIEKARAKPRDITRGPQPITGQRGDPSMYFDMISTHCAKFVWFNVLCMGDTVKIWHRHQERTGIVNSVTPYEALILIEDTGELVNKKFSKHALTIVSRGHYYYQEYLSQLNKGDE